jgi:hypothetical protein
LRRPAYAEYGFGVARGGSKKDDGESIFKVYNGIGVRGRSVL